jgi:hypothetical protein
MVDVRVAAPLVALVTYADLPALTADDRLLVAALEARGVRAMPAVWSDPTVDWSAFSAVVVRSCWDYFLRAREFFAWVAQLESDRVNVYNSASILRWNAEKTYLRDLAAHGIPVVPTHWLEVGATESLEAIRRRTGWSELVVKPAISGSAHDTWRTPPGAEDLDDARLDAMTSSGRVLVQPLVETIVEEGEWSLIFIGGAFSHAVFKRPRTGDFRVQIEHGGSAEAMTPLPALIARAQEALDAAPVEGQTTLYARVDGCVIDGELVLMELELIEPVLFLGTSACAAVRLADVLVARLG